jgi:DnaJ-class molecular chaperone
VKPDRFIKKSPCPNCSGTGERSSLAMGKCRDCDGKGWTEQQPGEEKVCSHCNGGGRRQRRTTSKCTSCEGKGYSVQILEHIFTKEPCIECDDSGKIDAEIRCECRIQRGIDFQLPLGDCDICEGAGTFVKEVTCPTCGGSGWFAGDEEAPKDVTPGNAGE